jgi:hypothetical protein
MSKDDRQPLDDDLRPEYERSDFGELVRGKYVEELEARLECEQTGVIDSPCHGQKGSSSAP